MNPSTDKVVTIEAGQLTPEELIREGVNIGQDHPGANIEVVLSDEYYEGNPDYSITFTIHL